MVKKGVPTLWLRFGARVLDVLVLVPAYIVFTLLFSESVFMLSVLGILVSGGYEFYMLSKYGQTLGKRVAKIKVVGLNKSTLTQEQIVKRIAVYLLPSNLPNLVGLGIIGFVWSVANLVVAYKDKVNHQAIHDMVAETKVVFA